MFHDFSCFMQNGLLRLIGADQRTEWKEKRTDEKDWINKEGSYECRNQRRVQLSKFTGIWIWVHFEVQNCFLTFWRLNRNFGLFNFQNLLMISIILKSHCKRCQIISNKSMKSFQTSIINQKVSKISVMKSWVKFKMDGHGRIENSTELSSSVNVNGPKIDRPKRPLCSSQ